MKKLLFVLLIPILLIGTDVNAQQLTISDLQIAASVQNQQPIGVDTSFTADIGNVFCFTRVEGVKEDVRIYQVWYHKDQEKARIQLTLEETGNGIIWGSQSIMETMTGPWRVMIEDSNGAVLASTSFRIRGTP